MYTSIIHGLVRIREPDKAWELFDTLRMQHLFQPDTVTYNEMIQACIADERAERALQLRDEMRVKNLHPDETTFSALLYVLATRRGIKTINLFFQNQSIML